MNSKTGFLALASVLVLAACSGGSDGAGAGGAGPGPGPGMGGNNPPGANAANAWASGTQQAPNDTDQAPNDTQQAPNNTDQAPNDTQQAPNATDDAPGGGGGGVLPEGADCNTICNSISEACPEVSVPQEALDDCREGCHEAMSSGCYAQMAIAIGCAAAAACTMGVYDQEAVEQACASQFQGVDCNGGVVIPGGDGDGDSDPPPVVGGSGCAGLLACCGALEGDLVAQCQGFYDAVVAAGDQACSVNLMTYQAAGLCP